MSVIFPELSKNPSYPSTDGPDLEKANLVNEAKLGIVKGRERFESNLRRLVLLFEDMPVNDKIAIDNFARTVRTGVLFEFGANLAGNYYLDQGVQQVRFYEMPQYKMSGYNLWDITMKVDVKGL